MRFLPVCWGQTGKTAYQSPSPDRVNRTAEHTSLLHVSTFYFLIILWHARLLFSKCDKCHVFWKTWPSAMSARETHASSYFLFWKAWPSAMSTRETHVSSYFLFLIYLNACRNFYVSKFGKSHVFRMLT